MYVMDIADQRTNPYRSTLVTGVYSKRVVLIIKLSSI